ncbi:MAG: DUF928 domain-containing protein [Oscillatoria sp. SIO1A7]|nr:DUF928 domain-containing protein [Oscillatoria sp. SIO1A7]
MNATQSYLKLALAIALSLATFSFYPLLARSQSSLLVGQGLPEVGDEEAGPPPDNQREPGGGLSPEKPSCGYDNKSMSAIVPLKNWVLTASPTPSFWFYFPDSATDISSGEFVLLTQDGQERLYKTKFKLPEAVPGIVSITLPESLDKGNFDEGIYYWQVRMHCSDPEGEEPDPLVYGWVKRVLEITTNPSETTYPRASISYDDITNLAASLRNPSNPNRSQIQQKWRELLDSIELTELAEKKILGEVEPNI